LKIAISTDSGMVSPHFGRAPEFTIIEIENNKLIGQKVLPNPGHSTGSIPRFINEQGAECMITGGMGHRAMQFFGDYGIDIIVGVTGKIDEVIKKILDGTLEGGESLCNPRGGKGYGIDKVHTEEDDDHHHHQH
jgi:predicted Fe-Mo cluster-binding NifX family protein